MDRPIYFDYHATTPVDPRALEAMLPYFTEKFGNAASRNHSFGWSASRAVDASREQLAHLIGAHHRDVVFTSGATESNNLALKGVACARRSRGNHIVTALTEHNSVVDTCRYLEGEGYDVTWLQTDCHGIISAERVAAALTERTILVSVMTANNEIGVVQPMAEISRVAHERGALVHTDASQAVGKIPFDVDAMGVDLVSFTAHKMYGPKGVGALFVRRRDPSVEISAIMHGGGQERGLRSGTLNVPAIVGFGKAAELCQECLPTEAIRVAELRDWLLAGLRASIPGLVVNGTLDSRLPHNLNVSFPDIESESLGMAMDDVAVSSGSACSTGKAEPSHVLKALGLNDELALASIRFGLGRWTTEEEVDYVVGKVSSVVARLRELKAELGI